MNSHSAFFKLLGLIVMVLLLAWIADQNGEVGAVAVALMAATAVVWLTFNYKQFQSLATKFGYSAPASNPVVNTGFPGSAYV